MLRAPACRSRLFAVSVRVSLSLAALPAFGVGCSDQVAPDPYQGTIDPGAFDTAFGGPAKSAWPNTIYPCLAPRRGFGGGSSGIDGQTWWYLGGLSSAQLDISNAADPAKALPPSVYEISGCDGGEGRAEPITAGNYDARTDNYLTDRQYPVVSYGTDPTRAGAASEPTSVASYRPWHVVVPVALRDSIRGRMGCNDIKSERSLLERAGWSRENKTFPEGAPFNFDFRFPSRDDIRAGKVTFKDWPMMSVATVLMKTPIAGDSCPFVTGSTAKYPRYPGDPEANFQFPAQHWLRGLLGGYLDGGSLPVTTDPLLCADILRVATGKSCSMTSDCNAAGNEVCTSGRCLAPIPVCPQVNDLYVAVDEVPIPSAMTAGNPMANATVELKDAADPTKKRTADILAIFSATPADPGYSPVCRLRFFDKKKVTCSRSEPDMIAPRPLCSAAEIKASPGAVLSADSMGKPIPNYYVHCLFEKKSQ
jgi:hypothetical protein